MLICTPFFAFGQQVHQELQEVVEAEVVEIVSEKERAIMGTGATALVQEVRAKVQTGERSGSVIEFENDLVVLKPGDEVFLNRLLTINGDEYYVFKDVDRRGALILLAVLFFAVLVVFAGKQGLRAFGSLVVSIAAILFILVPLLLAGHHPVLTSLGVASLVLAIVLFGTHGINARSTIAFVGTVSAVAVTSAIAMVWVSFARLTGFGSDVSVYLNFNTGGTLDFAGLLLGAIIIGILGVLDDVSITQSSVVQELKAANTTLTMRELYTRASRVGKDHVGSLVNTLALAYVGVSLPLVLLMAGVDTSLGFILNQEIVAAELVRIIVSSIGLILVVPLTTLAAAWWFASHDAANVVDGGHHHAHG
jgi:uncharacterized membrane protein